MRTVVVVLVLARSAVAEPVLDTATTVLVPGTVPIQLVVGSTIDRDAGTASFDDGTSRFEVRVRELGPRFDGRLDLIGLVDASERGIDIESAQVDRSDGRVVVVPRATPNALQPALVELAYVPWNREATLIMIYSDASAKELPMWQALAGRMIRATQVEPAVTTTRVGPYVMSVPRAWTVTRHPTFDELASRGERCTIRSIDDPDHSVPLDATNLRKRTWRPDDEEWLWVTGDRTFYEFTNTDAGVRTRCEASDEQVLKTLLRFIQFGRRAPRVPALARIHSLLR